MPFADKDLRDLQKQHGPTRIFEIAREVEQTMSTPGWQAVCNLLANEQQRELTRLVSALHEHAEYARSSGYIRGLKAAVDAARTVLDYAEKVRDEETKAAETAARTRE